MSNDEQRLHQLQITRERIGTASTALSEANIKYVRGGEDVSATLITGHKENWYRGIYVMAVQTWGGPRDSAMLKWNKATPEERALVVRAVLERKALPLALEQPQFLFEIAGCSRSAFDQIARARIGVTISSMGTRDNPHVNLEVVVPPTIYDRPEAFNAFMEGTEQQLVAYKTLIEQGRSWQDARAALPMSMMWRFCLNINYAALSSMCGKRLQMCEQYDTVAVAWKLREELGKHYAMLAEVLRPSCDWAKRCTYHEADSVSELFGCLFKGCGRWPDPTPYYEFNESSTDPEDIAHWIKTPIPAGDAKVNWEEAFHKDAHWFNELF